jgi:hypothetical protein
VRGAGGQKLPPSWVDEERCMGRRLVVEKWWWERGGRRRKRIAGRGR